MEWPFCRRYGAKYSSGLGILLLVFSLWWHYFDRTAQRMLRPLGTTIVWGYGHYFIVADEMVKMAINYGEHRARREVECAQRATHLPRPRTNPVG